MADTAVSVRKTPLRDILAYAMGDGANSLVMNTFYSFAMLYYTKAMGMSGTNAGVAMAITTLWDAITDPLMGHITDNTRSRFGRRHPYMLIGGFAMVLCFYGIWAVPMTFRTPQLLFWYLVVMNVLLRTASTVFAVPFVALGFEICTDYNQRTTLQSVRGAVNMAVNLTGPAILGWAVFLRDRDGEIGSGVTIPDNFKHMGFAFSAIALFFLLYTVFATRKYAVDSRNNPEVRSNRLGDILRNLTAVLLDPLPRMVFVFIAVLFIAVVLVTSLQMFIYVDFMKFTGVEKTLVHGSTMIAAAIGAILAAPLVRRLDKKPAIFVLLAGACCGNIVLVLLFGTGLVRPGSTPFTVAGQATSVATLVFLVFHVCYHLGATSANTIANSMMADVSEINRYYTGVLKDGSYSAMLSFVLKMSISFGQLLCGLCLDAIGYDSNAEHQPVEVARRMMFVAFAAGSLITLLALVWIVRYPVNRKYMYEIKAALTGVTPHCRYCGYDLTGNVSGICPECGAPIASESSPA